jgi:secreted PhoX family phosphatase
VLRSGGAPMATSSSLLNSDIKDLNSYGKQFKTRWVDLHTTTRANLTETFCAGDAAKAAKATAFKRPENGVLRPGTHFGEFFFTETGDTNAISQANNGYGGFGGIFRLRQDGPSASRGTLTLFAKGDLHHTGFDNIAFADARQLVVVEDAGDGLHTQRNALDSAYLYRVSGDYDDPPKPVRVLAEGRDPSATIDSALGDAKTPGFVNDGDNEITGIHISDGDPTTAGLLGAKVPRLFTQGWRVFWTQQHGDNVTWEIVPDLARPTR